MPNAHAPITVWYDGDCNLCSRFVRFVAARDMRRLISFQPLASLNRPLAQSADSIVVQEGESWFVKSAAVFKVIERLSGGWKAFGLFRLLPLLFRDWVYDWVARHRYQWFGKSAASCALKMDS